MDGCVGAGQGGCQAALQSIALSIFGAHDIVEQQRGLGVMLDEPPCLSVY